MKKGKSHMKGNYSLQLYSVHDLAEKNFEQAVADVAKLGFKIVEPCNFFGRTADEVCALMEKHGLTIGSTHSSWLNLRPTKLYETIAYHKAIGNKNYVVPGAKLDTLEAIEDFCNVMNYAQPILAAEGINLSYHNHSHEFVLMPWGSTIHSELEMRTDLNFQLDIFWLYNAGVDPLAAIDRLLPRVSSIHLKDGLRATADTPARGKSLGEGGAPVKEVYEKALALGLPMVVESEGRDPDSLSEVTRCVKYLESIEG